MERPGEVDARFARYEATLDHRDLWPEVPRSAFRVALEEVARVTAGVLTGAAPPIRLAVPLGASVRAMGVAACVSGMGPLLGFWCESGRVAADQPLADLLAMHLDHGRWRAARLRREFERILPAFADRAIEVVVLKGTHTGYRYFPEPGTRPATDIDLLVKRRDGAAARRVLGELGFREYISVEPQHRSHWAPPGAEQTVRSVELAHVDNPWSVDLHVSLDRRLFPGLTVGFGSGALVERERWDEFVRPVCVLPQPLSFAYLALHASSHFHTMQLIRLVELVLVARRDFASDTSAWTAFDRLVARSGTGRFLFPALELAERLVPGTIEPAVRGRLDAAAPARLRRIVQGLTPGSAQQLYRYPPDPPIVWVASPCELLAYVSHVVWPWRGPGRVTLRDVVAVQRRRLGRLVSRLRRGPSQS